MKQQAARWATPASSFLPELRSLVRQTGGRSPGKNGGGFAPPRIALGSSDHESGFELRSTHGHPGYVMRFRLMASLAMLPLVPAAAQHVEDVRFPSGTYTLAGTLVFPSGTGPHAAVALIHGSDPHGRYMDVAQQLASLGLAVLAYDKRGTGASTGSLDSASLHELARDAAAAARFLSRHPRVDQRRVGVWGVSQGGWLGPIAAAAEPAIRYVVIVSGTTVTPGDQMLHYFETQWRKLGVPDSIVMGMLAVRRRYWDYLDTGRDRAAVDSLIRKLRNAAGYPQGQVPGLLPPSIPTEAQVSSGQGALQFRFARSDRKLDARPALGALTVPVFVALGAADGLIPVEQSRVDYERLVKDVRVVVVEGAEHGMRRAATDPFFSAPEYVRSLERWLREKRIVVGRR